MFFGKFHTIGIDGYIIIISLTVDDQTNSQQIRSAIISIILDAQQ